MSNKVFWKTKSGQLVDVDDMSDNHVRNAFKMLLRNIEKYNKVLQIRNREARQLSDSVLMGGEMANEFNDNYLSDEDDDRWDEADYRIFSDLV